jgi:uncharacterized protein YbjT (DUF2867 family)
MTTILVTGATGNVGRPLLDMLTRSGVRVRAVTRRPHAADLPAGVEVFSSARAGLVGSDAVFLNSRALGPELPAVVDDARRVGVTRLVALSAINADDDFARQPSRFRGDRNLEAEQLAVASGLEWVSLRPTVFVTNFAGMWGPQLRGGDVVTGPYPTASVAPIVESDIAAVAARALVSDELLYRRLPLTGPESLSNTELLSVIATVTGRNLRYQEATPDQVRNRFADLGFPAGFADAYLGLMAETLDRPAHLTREVPEILGRPATSFASWVTAHREWFTPALIAN